LKWLHPHSISGAIVLVVGFLITASSIIGNYYLVNSHFLHVYLLACALNSIFGAIILKGPPDVRLGFKFGIALQLSLVYICFRVRPAQLHFALNFIPLGWLDKLIGMAQLDISWKKNIESVSSVSYKSTRSRRLFCHRWYLDSDIE